MDKHIAILAIPEIDETTVNEARKIFFAYKDKGIVTNCVFDDDIWNLNNETAGFRFNFQLDKDKFKSFEKNFKINLSEFKDYLKTYIMCQMGELELHSLRTIIYYIKKIIYEDVSDIESLLNVCHGNWISRVSEFFSMIPAEGRQKEIIDWMTFFDEAEDYVRAGKTGEKRTLATFESYFRFDEIIKKFWQESQDEDEKLFFFPIWMWWNVSGILPLRPCEFVVTPRNCLTNINGKYTLTIRRNRIKGSRKTKSYKIDKDFEINRYTIPVTLAKEIEWYLEKTKDYPEASTHTLFVTKTHYAMWERQAPYTSRYFSYINLSTCLRYFFNIIVKDRYGYKIIYDNKGQRLPEESCIEYLHLGDTRHIALINLIAEGATPMIAMMLAGHENPEMSSHYFSNIAQLIECRTYRQYKKLINGKQTYTLSRYTSKLPEKKSIPLDGGGRCCCKDVADGNFKNCYKVIGPGGELGFCKNCEFYRDNTRSFSDSKKLYVNKIENECNLLAEIVKRVRKGKGEQEDIVGSLLRLRDKEYSYQQYLLERMEMEANGQTKDL